MTAATLAETVAPQKGVADLHCLFASYELHLREVVDRYGDPGCCREHKGFGVYPEDHLWWAAEGFLELESAIQEMG